MKLFEITKILKAGFIPYFKDGNNIFMLFVLSSDPSYGGTKYMIAKGHVDDHETEIQAALREANEECGLIVSNLKKDTIKIGWKGNITGMVDTSTMTIFIGEVFDRNKFEKPGWEISSVKWMTPEEFYKFGRNSQSDIVRKCAGKIK